MIIQKNSIYSSRFKLFWINWVPRKLLIIPVYVDIFMFVIFEVLNVITTVWKLGIFLLSVALYISSMKQRQKTFSFFYKLKYSSYSFSWTFMNLNYFGLSQISLGFNSFAIADLSLHLYLELKTSTTSFTCLGAPTDLSILI